jgi:hypothetical protein
MMKMDNKLKKIFYDNSKSHTLPSRERSVRVVDDTDIASLIRENHYDREATMSSIKLINEPNNVPDGNIWHRASCKKMS